MTADSKRRAGKEAVTSRKRALSGGSYDERFPRGNCQQNARWMTLLHLELAYIEGYLVFAEPAGTERRMEHAWNETPDGQVVDSTAWALVGQTLPYRYEPDPAAWARLAAIAEGLMPSKRASP